MTFSPEKTQQELVCRGCGYLNFSNKPLCISCSPTNSFSKTSSKVTTSQPIPHNTTKVNETNTNINGSSRKRKAPTISINQKSSLLEPINLISSSESENSDEDTWLETFLIRRMLNEKAKKKEGIEKARISKAKQKKSQDMDTNRAENIEIGHVNDEKQASKLSKTASMESVDSKSNDTTKILFLSRRFERIVFDSSDFPQVIPQPSPVEKASSVHILEPRKKKKKNGNNDLHLKPSVSVNGCEISDTKSNSGHVLNVDTRYESGARCNLGKKKKDSIVYSTRKPNLGECSPNLIQFLQNIYSNRVMESTMDMELQHLSKEDLKRTDPVENDMELLQLVDLTLLSDSEDSSQVSDEDSLDISENDDDITAEPMERQSITINGNGNSNIGNTQGNIATNGRKREEDRWNVCVICDKRSDIKYMIQCPDCHEFAHRLCNKKEYGDENGCWNCEQLEDDFVDDSELTLDDARQHFHMLKGLSNDIDPQILEGKTQMNNENQFTSSFATSTETQQQRRWKEFLDIRTSNIDATFQAITKEINEELQDETKRKQKYSKGFTTPESFNASISAVVDAFAQREDIARIRKAILSPNGTSDQPKTSDVPSNQLKTSDISTIQSKKSDISTNQPKMSDAPTDQSKTSDVPTISSHSIIEPS